MVVNIAELLPQPLLRQDITAWLLTANGVAGMHQAQEGVVIGVSVRAVRTVPCIAPVRIWPLSSTTSASSDLVVFDHGDTVVAVLNEVHLSPVVRAIYAAAPLAPNHLVPRAGP